MLEANSSCNLKCLHCTREDLVSRGWRTPKNLTKEELTFILHQLRECPLEIIKFEGLSEPLLHPHFDQMASLLREFFPAPATHVIVFTNFQYHAAKINWPLLLEKIDTLCLSIDGIGPTYEKLRKGAQFSKFQKNLAFLSKTLPPEVVKKKVFLNFTATVENYQELPGVYALKDQYGLAGVRINLAQNWDVTQINRHPIPQEMKTALSKYGSDLKGVGGWRYQDCFWPFHGTVIDVYGDVRQCVLSTTQKPLGNVFRQSLKEIFESSPKLLLARERLSRDCAPEDCRTCDYHGLSAVLEEIHGQKWLHKPFRKIPEATP
jgi:radical SAM protein with 4Fe4S-binding SPASM domain